MNHKLSLLAGFRGLILALALAALFIYSLVGCAALSSAPAKFPTSPDAFYRRDMEVYVDGVKYPGCGVLPEKASYNFEVRTKHDMDRFSSTNCHKQEVEEKVDGTNLFKKTAKYKFIFTRKSSIELDEPCPLQMAASADGNDHSWAFFDFQDKNHTLKARLECNGSQVDVYGVSICQSRAGLTQKISFAAPVFMDDAVQLPTTDNKNFTFELPQGRAVYIFCAANEQCHRLTTLGYDQAWLREK